MPLQRRLPKRGFHNIFKTEYQIVNVGDLKRFAADSEVDHESFRASGLINKRRLPVKLLGQGEIDRPLTVSVHKCSKTAQERIEKAGGQVRLIKR